MQILWCILGVVLLFFGAGCFGMARGSFIPAGERAVGLVLGSSLCFAVFFLLILLAGLRINIVASIVFLAILAGWFERELARMFFRMATAAHGLDRKAPDK